MGAIPKEAKKMATILCVLDDDPADGYPPEYARGEVLRIESYPDGQTTPTPEALDFTPGESCSDASRARSGCAGTPRRRGHELIVTSRTGRHSSSSDGSRRPTSSSHSRSGPT